MRRYSRALRYGILALLLLIPHADANISQGMGMGIHEVQQMVTHGAGGSCATNFVFDWTDGCNAITAVIR